MKGQDTWEDTRSRRRGCHPWWGKIFCDAIITCLEIDMRRLSNLAITPEWIYTTSTGQMKEGLAVAEREATRLRCLSMKDTSTQTEFEDDIIPSNEAVSGPESSVGASNVDGLELLATLTVPSSSSSGSSTPSSAETLLRPRDSCGGRVPRYQNRRKRPPHHLLMRHRVMRRLGTRTRRGRYLRLRATGMIGLLVMKNRYLTGSWQNSLK